MEREELLQRQNKMLNCLSCLPRRILAAQDQKNVPEFVLHDLCDEHCFNLNRAAYLIDNPDFNCLKGVAGVSRAEAYSDGNSIWNSPERFNIHMQAAPFNQKVRHIERCSLKTGTEGEHEMLNTIAQELGFL